MFAILERQSFTIQQVYMNFPVKKILYILNFHKCTDIELLFSRTLIADILPYALIFSTRPLVQKIS